MRNAQAGDEMQAHKTRMFWFSLLLAGLLTSALACNRPRKVEVSAQGTAQESESAEPGAGANAPTAPAADDSTSLPDAGAPRTAPVDMVGEFASDSSEMVASSVVRPMAVDDLTGRLKRLKFQARREIVAARTAIENIPSYTRSLGKFEREFAEWGMFTAVPAEPGYDVVLAQGIFYLLGVDAGEKAQELLKRMFHVARESVGCCAISTWADHQTPGEYYLDPALLLAWGGRLTKRLVLRHDHHPGDVCVYLFKS